MNKTVSILGCGWLGKPLAIKLIAEGYTVKGSTTSISKFNEFKNLGIAPYLITLENISVRINEFLASEILVVALPSKNYDGFKKLINYIEKSSIKKVLFISSTSVYISNNELVTEASPLQNVPLVSIENLFIENKFFKATIVRFAGLFGYDRKPGNFFKNGRKIPNPEGFVNMIHQDDCVLILEKIIKNNYWNELFNACAGTHPKRRDYYIKTTLDINNEPPVFIETEHTVFKIISNKKLKAVLDYKFKYGNLMNINYENFDS
ncbi:dTDP-glucose 4,6-dehydratase [Lutibacter sp. A80]|uniref:dTDP-glucose 4,6-dehydratase n=1 Tax=Lutibacter sp. A80 TaxID=2918453 RepID=UPI001F06C08F|nr:dTDP-glucose 4,6-dehydratase [Lutibacter sp. A80]UMB61462.1 dTDP-glucose 4,6-dehydratase [Lutibacter sp. A80]